MKKIITWLFGKKPEKKPYEKPVLQVRHSIVPQSFLNSLCRQDGWDSELYKNQTVIQDI